MEDRRESGSRSIGGQLNVFTCPPALYEALLSGDDRDAYTPISRGSITNVC